MHQDFADRKNTSGNNLSVVHVLEATRGGTRRHLLDLATRQCERGYQVYVAVSTHRNPDIPADLHKLQDLGVNTKIIEMGRRIAPLRDLMAIFRLLCFLRHVSPDILHAHSAKAGIVGRVAARLAGCS